MEKWPPGIETVVVYVSRRNSADFRRRFPSATHPELLIYEDAPASDVILACSGCGGFMNPCSVGMNLSDQRRYYARAKLAHSANYAVTPELRAAVGNINNVSMWFEVSRQEDAYALVVEIAKRITSKMAPQCRIAQRGSILDKSAGGCVVCRRCAYVYPYQTLSSRAQWKNQFADHFAQKRRGEIPPIADEIRGMWTHLLDFDGQERSDGEKRSGAPAVAGRVAES